MSKIPKAILFDADGTIYDSELLNYEANRKTAKALHGFDLSWNQYDTHVRRGTLKSAQMLEMLGVDIDHEVYARKKWDKYQEMIATDLKPMPGIVEFLKWCKQKSVICVVVSAASDQYVETCLEAVGLRDYFDNIISSRHVNNKVKPDPHPYLLGLKVAGLKATDAIAIEDTDKGVASAKAAGLKCVGILNDANSHDELKQADLIINNYDELRKKLD